MAERGAQVLDADTIGHVLLNQVPSRDEVVARFGKDVLARDENGAVADPPEIDRVVLGQIVFAEPSALKALEAILHPRMRKTFVKAIGRAARRKTASAVVLDAAILLEARWHDLCDLIVFVDAPEELRLARLQDERGWNAEAVQIREAAQRPLGEKRKRADFVIDNAEDSEALAAAVVPLWDKLVRRPAPNAPSRRPSPPVPPTDSL